MNIAFEISPLLLASGSFGDKSGVYRYYYGLIKAYGNYLKKNKINKKIILFSFDKNLVSFPPTKDIINLLNNEHFLFISNPIAIKKDASYLKFRIFDLALRPFLKLVNLVIPIKKIYSNFSNEIIFQEYVLHVKKQLKKNAVSTIYHSETCFYPLKGFKNIITIYDLTPIFMSHFHRKETIDLSQRKLYFGQKYCEGIVCISQSTKNDLLKYYPLYKYKKIVICYPGSELKLLSYRKSFFSDINFLLGRQKNIIKKGRYLLYYGTFEPRKNIISVVEAFYELQKNRDIPKDFKLILTGGDGWGEKKKMIKNFIKENYPLKEKNSIIMFDFLNDDYLVSLIKNSLAVVYPSLYEGFGLPVLESMSLGTAVICSNNSSLPEVGGNAVIYASPNDYFDLKNKIKYLINHPNVAKSLSKKGLKQSKKFSWEKSSHILHGLMQKLK